MSIIGTKTGIAVEDFGGNVSGTVEKEGATGAQTGFIAQQETPGTYGIFSLRTDGKWTYTLSDTLDEVQQLGENAVVTETFLVNYDNKEFTTVKIQVVGKNDEATIVGNLALNLSPTSNKVTSTLKVVDNDLNESSFNPVSQHKGKFGSFSLSAAGAVEFTVDAAAGALAAGQIDQLKIATADGTEFLLKVVVSEASSTQQPIRIDGTEGNDLLQVAVGNNNIFGGAGTDIVQFGGARASYSVRKGAAGNAWDVEGQGQHTLTEVERLKFSDTSLAIDIEGNAGKVARILGAVFGPASIQNAKYVGIGLGLLDSGMSYESLMALALDTALGKGASNTQIVNKLYSNVVGVAPNVAALANFVGMLDSGSLTKGSLGVMAADTGMNAANIGLVGLADTGLAYTVS